MRTQRNVLKHALLPALLGAIAAVANIHAAPSSTALIDAVRGGSFDDVRALLANLAADKVKKFPTPQLIMSSSTVEDAWESIVERTRYDSRF